MKNALKKIVLATTLLITPIISYGQSLDTRTYAEIRLDLEKGTTSKDHKRLETLMKEAKTSLPTLKTNNYTSAIQVLQEMQNFLAKKGFSYQYQDFLNEGLKTKKIDCDLYSLLFASIAEKKEYPVKMVEVGAKGKVGSHAFIKWYLDNGEVINWETTTGFAYKSTTDILPPYLKTIIEKEYDIKEGDMEIVEHDSKGSYIDRTIDGPALDRNLRILPLINRLYAQDMARFYEQKSKKDHDLKWTARKQKLEENIKKSKR